MYSKNIEARFYFHLYENREAFAHSYEDKMPFKEAFYELLNYYNQNDEKRTDRQLEDEILLNYASTGTYEKNNISPDFQPILVKYKNDGIDYNNIFIKKHNLVWHRVFFASYVPESVLNSLSDDNLKLLAIFRLNKEDYAACEA